MMEGPRNFNQEGLEGIKKVPSDENLDRSGKIEKAETSVIGMFNAQMETTGVIRHMMEDNRSSFSGLEERNF